MKRLMCVLMVMLLIITVVGCGNTDNGETPDSTETPPESADSENTGRDVDFWRIGSASIGGNGYTIGNAMAQLLSEEIGVKASSQSTGGSVDNCHLLNSGEIDAGLIQANTIYDAYNGQNAFEGEPIDKLRAIGNVYLNYYHVVVTNDSGIEAIEDFKGKRVALGPMGGGIEVNGTFVLEQFGLSRDDYQAIYSTNAEMWENLKVGQVDGLVYAVAKNAANVADVMGTGKVKLLSLPKDKVDAIGNEYPIYSTMALPAGTYANQPEDCISLSASYMFATTSEVSEDSVYEFTKALYENNEYLVGHTAILKEAIPENALASIAIPLHPGAEKYYKEIGILK